jgi:hypothetical protein
MELANFRVEKKCQHFQEKLAPRVVQVGKFHMHVFSATPDKKSKMKKAEAASRVQFLPKISGRISNSSRKLASAGNVLSDACM